MAEREWVRSLPVRGSASYGQKFSDAVFGDQDGNEGQDILYGVSAAVQRYLSFTARTTTMFPLQKQSQLFIALKDVGVDAVFLRCPREGHGLSELKHQIDATDRSITWYEKHFPKPGDEGVTNVQP